MRYPSWDTFKINCAETKEKAFEALARILFKERYGLKESLPYFKNHAGNETDVINHEGEIIGFQAKYFEDKISDSQFIHSLQEARDNNPNQTKVILYTNKVFGNPTDNSPVDENCQKKPKALLNIENKANGLGLEIEWMCDHDILDAVAKCELAYNLFFNPDVDLIHLEEYIEDSNKSYLNTIKDSIVCNGNELRIQREKSVSELASKLAQRHHVIIEGESGSGKSAILKNYYQQKQEDEYILCFNASEFDTDDVNSLFHLRQSYTLAQIIQYYNGADSKYVFIDSAEKLLEIQQKKALLLFITSMQDSGWTFVCTVRESFSSELKALFKDIYNLDFSDIVIPPITDGELDCFLSDNKIPKPGDAHLYRRIHNLFYLARYAEVSNTDVLSMKEFRQRVWDMKMTGGSLISSQLQEEREDCLLTMAERKMDTGRFLISKEGLNKAAVSSLIQDEILAKERQIGYYFTHDIYLEWSADMLMDRLWYEIGDVEALLAKLSNNLTAVNSFRRWYLEKIECREDFVWVFADYVFEKQPDVIWQNAILSAILCSTDMAGAFFKKYEVALLSNNYHWLTIVSNCLNIECQEVMIYISFKGDQHPIMRPIGSGWNAAVDFIYEHYDGYVEVKNNLIVPILQSYCRLEKTDKDIAHKAGLMALKPHLVVATTRKKGGKLYFLDDKKEACELVSYYSAVIHEELAAIIREVVENKWVEHNAPYNELMSHIVAAKDNASIPLCLLYPKEMFDLLELFWTKPDSGRNKEDRLIPAPISRDIETVWGLNQDKLMINCFPPSALQTCIGKLLGFHPAETVAFIIRFVDKCVACYAKSPWKAFPVEEILMKLPDGRELKKIGNLEMWCLYRGTTGGSPYLMQCIHMALEEYLLNVSKGAQYEMAGKLLDEIIHEAKSLSLLGVVGSIVLAYPDEYYQQLLIMMSNLQFLKFDQSRCSSEIASSANNFAYYGYERLLKDRQESNALKHRKMHLAEELCYVQFTLAQSEREEDKAKLQEVYKIVDSLWDQYDKEPEDEKLQSKFLLSKCDYRKMRKEEVALKDGGHGIVLYPVFDEEQEAVSKQTELSQQKFMRSSSLRLWASLRADYRYDNASAYEYDKEPLKALALSKEIRQELAESTGKFEFMPGDEYIPSLVCAVLIRDFGSILPESQFDYCTEEVLEVIENAQFMVGSSLSSFVVAFEAVAVLMKSKPLYNDKYKQAMLCYINQNEMYKGVPCFFYVAKVVYCGELWKDSHGLMADIVDSFIKDRVPDGNLEELSYDDAERLLCLISVPSGDNEIERIADTCLERVSHMWDHNDKRKNLYTGRRHYSAQNVARYIMKSDFALVPRYISYFERYLNTDHYDTFLPEFLLRATLYKEYDAFWKVWDCLYNTVVKERKHWGSDEMLSTYMLRPYYMKIDDTFRFEAKDIAFFERISHDIGHVPQVLLNLAMNFCFLAKAYYMEAIPIFAYIVENHGEMDLKDKGKDIMIYMERIMKRLYTDHERMIITNEKLHSQVLHILDFMERNGSSYAASLKALLI